MSLRSRLRQPPRGASIALPPFIPPSPPPVVGALPGWAQLADIPAKPPTAGGSATISPAGGTLASQIAALDGTTSRVFCAPGNYGDSFSINKFPAMGMVTLAAADPANPPYFSAWQTSNQNAMAFENAGNLAFDGWEFRAPLVTNEGDPAAIVANIVKLNFCTNMLFTRCKFQGGVGSSSGAGLGRSLNIVCGTNIQLDRNTFQDVSYGFVFQSYQGTKCVNSYVGFNDFSNLKAVDFIDAYGVQKFLMEFNELWDVRWLKDDLHTDTFQGGSMYDGVGTGGVEQLVQRNNLCGATVACTYINGPAADGRTHNYPQFSWLTHEPSQGVFDNVCVVDNIVLGPSNNAIANNGGGLHYYVARNIIQGSSRTDWQTANGGNPVNPVIQVYGDVGDTSIDDITIIDNQGGTVIIPGIATNVTNARNVAIADADDASFAASRAAWRTARTAYF